MKKLSLNRTIWLFSGSVLGAGFVSGQELWQFFGSFGFWGGMGLVIALALFTLLGMLIFLNANTLKTDETDKAILPFESKILSSIIYYLQVIFLAGLVTIMISGAGELMSELLGTSKLVMCIAMTVITILLAMAGLEGVSKVFSLCVPIIVAATVIFAVLAVIKPSDGEFIPDTDQNGLLPNWFAAALTYASYNMFSAIGILCPFGKKADRKTLKWGAFSGGLILIVISASILIAMSKYPESTESAMPMLTLAKKISPILGFVYGILLLFGLLQSSVSCLVAATTYMEAKNEKLKQKNKLLTVIIGVLAFVGSLFGFGELVGTVYPVFGYLSALFAVGIIYVYIRHKKCA